LIARLKLIKTHLYLRRYRGKQNCQLKCAQKKSVFVFLIVKGDTLFWKF